MIRLACKISAIAETDRYMKWFLSDGIGLKGSELDKLEDDAWYWDRKQLAINYRPLGILAGQGFPQMLLLQERIGQRHHLEDCRETAICTRLLTSLHQFSFREGDFSFGEGCNECCISSPMHAVLSGDEQDRAIALRREALV